LEEEPGNNLYWHDPLLGHWEMCRAWSPASAGCPPSWYVRSDMLALYRDTTYTVPFATLGPVGPTALSTANFDAEFQAGVRATLGKSLGDWYRMEVTYFGSHSWDDTAAVRNTDDNAVGTIGNLYSPFSAFGNPDGIDGLDYNDFVSIGFESRLNSGEVNLRRRVLMRPGCYETSFIIGGRYLDIREEFAYSSRTTNPGPLPLQTDVGIVTHNKLIGMQIGLLGQFLIQPRCWVDCEVKGGIFQNSASLNRTFTVSEIAGIVASIPGNDQRDRTSFAGELSLQWHYQFAPSWTVYAGYHALWVTGVALGQGNFEADRSILALGPTSVRHNSDIVYHGPTFGCVFAW
jgi:hypothetical protein